MAEAPEDTFVAFLESIARANYFGEQDELDPRCKWYSDWDVLRYNYILWGLGFLVGLNFTHFD